MEFWDNVIETVTGFNNVSVALRLVLALIMGGLIGMERGLHGRAAGMRTHVLVCLGACMTALVGLFIQHINPGENVTRIAAQVISGIGFLGAGTIMIRNQSVITGLTTAAGVWCTATIGIALGYGFYLGATVATIIALITATLLTRLETGKKHLLRCYLELGDAGKVTATIEAIQTHYPTLKHPEITAPKSGIANAVGLTLSLILDKGEQEVCLKTLDSIDNVLFAVEE
ncbi:MAG: MgtC/SapB family protein [Ruminococcaceae bacterium]|nr:MgtC/SapB family protein [Oscillospiraceae bacterium]